MSNENLEITNSSKIKKDDGIYEFSEVTKLTGTAANWIPIPEEIVQGQYYSPEALEDNGDPTYEFGAMRNIVYIYCYIFRANLNNDISFTIRDILSFWQIKPDRRPGRINDKIKESIFELIEAEWLLTPSDRVPYDSSKNYAVNSLFILKFNERKAKERFRQKAPFATVYLDEVEKIANHKCCHKDVLVSTFVFLRYAIPRRRNKVYADYHNRIMLYKEQLPEVFNYYYSELCYDVQTTQYQVQKSVAILVELGLIYTETLQRKQYQSKNGELRWMTDYTLFCNTYKRDKDELLASGQRYYLHEIRNKKQKLNHLYNQHNH